MNLSEKLSLSKSELVITILMFLLVTAAVITTRLTRLTSGKAVHIEQQTSVIFQKTADLDALIDKLKEQEVDIDVEELKWAANLLGWRTFQRGRYELDGFYSYNSLLSKMARGIQDPVSLVILPGINPQLLADYVGNRMHFSSKEFLDALTDSAFLAEKDWTKEDLFGRMLPETYLIYWTSSPEDVIRRVLRYFKNHVEDPLQGRASEMGITISEALTMASIIEWEANIEEEKPIISGLYWNRLNRGMRLQADPTVNFAIGERRRLVFEDYRLEHDFNTYVNSGLPPAPITNPSLNTIKAALYPEDHNYLFMVANPDGGHTFTTTFAEHREESEKWRKWLQQQYRIKAQREAEHEQKAES